MKLKLELIAKVTADYINSRLQMLDFDVNELADTMAIKALSEIQEIVQNNELSDFDAMEQIVCVFEKYKISAGARHDFG